MGCMMIRAVDGENTRLEEQKDDQEGGGFNKSIRLK